MTISICRTSAFVAGMALAFVMVAAVEMFSAVVHIPSLRDSPAPWTKRVSMSPDILTADLGEDSSWCPWF